MCRDGRYFTAARVVGMDLETREVGRHLLVEVTDAVTVYNINEFRKFLFGLIEGMKHESIVMDLKNLPYIDSVIIGALISGLKKMQAVGGNFALVNVQDSARLILQLANLLKDFKIYTTEDEMYND